MVYGLDFVRIFRESGTVELTNKGSSFIISLIKINVKGYCTLNTMYAVVVYDETDETDFVPISWLTCGTSAQEIPLLVENRMMVKLYSPPWKNRERLQKVKRLCLDPQADWPIYSARILSTADTEQEARAKAKAAEDTSNVDDINLAKGKRRRVVPLRYAGDASNDSSDSDKAIVQKSGIKKWKSSDSKLASSQQRKTIVKPVAPDPPVLLPEVGSSECSALKDGQNDISSEAVMSIHNLSDSSLEPPLHTMGWNSAISIQVGARSSSCLVDRSVTSPDSVQTGDMCQRIEPVNNCSDATLQPLLATGCVLGSTDENSWPTISTPTSVGLSGRLMARILSKLEGIQQTQRQHGFLLQSLLQQMNMSDGQAELELAEGMKFPMETFDDLDTVEEKLKDSTAKHVLIQILVDNGGHDLREFVRRNMKYLMCPVLARKINLTGQKGKRSFKPLVLFEVLYAAAKKLPYAGETSRKSIEVELSSWFVNSRDRGSGGQTSQKYIANMDSDVALL